MERERKDTRVQKKKGRKKKVSLDLSSEKDVRRVSSRRKKKKKKVERHLSKTRQLRHVGIEKEVTYVTRERARP